jgi:hypothetical protein
VTILGTFTHIRSATPPIVMRSMGVYVCFSDARGAYDLRLECTSLSGHETVGFAEMRGFQSPDQLAVHEIGITIDNVTFPNFGDYEFRFHAGGEFLGSRKVVVQQATV